MGRRRTERTTAQHPLLDRKVRLAQIGKPLHGGKLIECCLLEFYDCEWDVGGKASFEKVRSTDGRAHLELWLLVATRKNQ